MGRKQKSWDVAAGINYLISIPEWAQKYLEICQLIKWTDLFSGIDLQQTELVWKPIMQKLWHFVS